MMPQPVLLDTEATADGMAAPDRGMRQPPPAAVVAASPFGQPVTFAGSTGIFHPGRAPVAVLMLGPICYEELCLRATWRSLAQALSAANIASLRFDYPGQGDAPEADDPQGLEDWFETIRAAADLLRQASGCTRLILLGQGLGGTLALQLAEALAPVEAAVLMAPVGNGKRYLRELAAWSRMVSDRIGIGVDPDDETRCAVAGLRIAPGRLKAIADLGMNAVHRATPARILLLARPGHGGDAAICETLTGLGATVEQRDYTGYETLTTDPTSALPPQATIAAVTGWIAERAQELDGALPALRKPAALAPADGLRGEGFIERPFRFGPDGRLFGVLCEPAGATAREPVLFVNAGREYRIGWARVTVTQARAFAARGIASLRFDASSIGDSAAAPDGPEEILYSARQIGDVRHAIDALEARGFRDPVLIGRCSGAYAAFSATVLDARVRRLVLVNNQRFVWDPDESVEDAIRYAHRSVGDFGATLKSKDGLRRMLTGQLRVGPAARYLLFRWLKKTSIVLAPVLGRLTKHGRLRRECHRRFAVLAARGVEISLVYAEGDVGLAEFKTYFGETGRHLVHYQKTSLTMIPDADHNFTHLGAARRLLDALLRIVAP